MRVVNARCSESCSVQVLVVVQLMVTSLPALAVGAVLSTVTITESVAVHPLAAVAVTV